MFLRRLCFGDRIRPPDVETQYDYCAIIFGSNSPVRRTNDVRRTYVMDGKRRPRRIVSRIHERAVAFSHNVNTDERRKVHRARRHAK